jgi:hypothetical protein
MPSAEKNIVALIHTITLISVSEPGERSHGRDAKDGYRAEALRIQEDAGEACGEGRKRY